MPRTKDKIAVQSQPPLIANAFQGVYADLCRLLDGFCEQYFDDESAALCRAIAAAICQPGSPVGKGKPESWACGIAYCFCRHNFLFDPADPMQVSTHQVYEFFNVSQATMYNKAREIRRGLQWSPLDVCFWLPSRLSSHPVVSVLQRCPPQMIQEAISELLGTDVAELLSGLLDEFSPRENHVRLGRVRSIPEIDLLFQLRVTLKHSVPPIWRLIEVPDCTLGELHHLLQAAMGWEDCHLYEFEVAKRRYTELDEEFDHDEADLDAWDFFLSDFIAPSRRKMRFKYIYDFGDYWEHEIVCESVRSASDADEPSCLEGARACPPEDVGGSWGYANMLTALADPNHEDHDTFVEWIGSFDADAFDIEKCRAALKGCWQALLDAPSDGEQFRDDDLDS